MRNTTTRTRCRIPRSANDTLEFARCVAACEPIRRSALERSRDYQPTGRPYTLKNTNGPNLCRFGPFPMS
jgi:hypothetical protein